MSEDRPDSDRTHELLLGLVVVLGLGCLLLGVQTSRLKAEREASRRALAELQASSAECSQGVEALGDLEDRVEQLGQLVRAVNAASISTDELQTIQKGQRALPRPLEGEPSTPTEKLQ